VGILRLILIVILTLLGYFRRGRYYGEARPVQLGA
jgi:hypothetical protein